MKSLILLTTFMSAAFAALGAHEDAKWSHVELAYSDMKAFD